MSANKVILLGRLGQDPELRYTQSQTPVCTLDVATTDYRTGPDGQRQEKTDWHKVVVWSKLAENCAKYLSKGREVYVEGKLETRSWETKEGEKRYVTEVIAQNVQFIGGTREQGQGQQRQQNQGQGQQRQQNQSQRQQQSGGPSYGYEDQGFNESPGLDDIPF